MQECQSLIFQVAKILVCANQHITIHKMDVYLVVGFHAAICWRLIFKVNYIHSEHWDQCNEHVHC